MAGPFHVNMPDLIAKLNELWEMAEEGGGGDGGTEIAVEQDGEEVADADTLNILAPLTAATDGAGRVKVGVTIPEGGDETSVFVVNNVNNVFTKAPRVTPVALSPASGITIDASLSTMFTLEMNQNITLHAPSNVEPGTTFQLFITQNASEPYEISLNGVFLLPAAGQRQLTQIPSAVDTLSCASKDGTNLICVLSGDHGGTPP